MAKCILMSIKPKYVSMILNKTKTIEVRKRFPIDYVGWVYIYCCKQRNNEIGCHINYKKVDGKVVARFWCDKVEEIKLNPFFVSGYSRKENEDYITNTQSEKDLLNKSVLSYNELDDYLKSKNGYAIHITEVEPFDKPKELNEFCKVGCEEYFTKHVFVDHPNFRPIYESELKQFQFTRAPESWCYVEIGE